MIDQTSQTPSGPIAYLSGEYPRSTDTFIQREVSGLRRHGLKIRTYSIRRAGPQHIVGPEQEQEAASTFFILEAALSPINLLRSHAKAIWRSPARYLSGLRLAIRTAPPGFRAFIYQLFYFMEAVVLADDMQRNGVVHLHNHIATASCTVAMLASKVSGIPYSFTMHGPDIFFEPIRWRIDEKIAQASFVVCISDFCRSQGMIFADKQHWNKMHIVHCGVEPERYVSPVLKREQSNTDSGNHCHLLFVGRLAAVKGIPVLFEALHQLRSASLNLRLTLIGDGPERAQLEREARNLGLASSITFAGYRSQAEVAAALHETDIFVLPSFAEGVPVVLMEALASAVPVITSRIAGIPELVEDKVNGLLVPPGDAASLARAIQTLANDPEARTAFGKAGRSKVHQHYSVNLETQWLAQLFNSYLAQSEPLPVRPAAATMNAQTQNIAQHVIGT